MESAMLTDHHIREHCKTLLVAIVGQQAAQVWWNSPNYQFNLETPHVVFGHNPGLVYDYLMKHSQL